MSAITTKFVKDHNFADASEVSQEELSQYAPEILELLTTGDPSVDREKRRQARIRLQKGYKYSKEQAFALIPDQRIGRHISQVTPKEGELAGGEVNISQISGVLAQRIVRDNLSERDVKAISRTLVKTVSGPIAGLSCLSRLRRELRTLNASEKIISATKIPDITKLSNEIQKKHSEQRKNEGFNYPDHFSLESVKERLDSYDVSNTPDKQALADIMIMLCIRPAKIKNLRITNGGEAITSGELKNPRKLRSTYLSSFLKKVEYIPKPYKPLLPSSLRKLEAVFAVVASGIRNLSKANTIASQALRHSVDNHIAPSDRYTIVNYRKRGQPYDQASSFSILDGN
ncbi:hypothetical protein RhiirC2_796228 [Rhizophagus irregularis]|uniref:Uncharacterized protein n=1 Tax=Rhizophagus irregularis TaxID=588596 RepID=A0A2N1MA15_9GLOM|nr:hypothetical protein RhiirC2_796228 [Rhizophagus irregularis]